MWQVDVDLAGRLMSQAEPPVRLVKDTSAVAFTLALHARLRTRHQNLVFSRYSLRAALGISGMGLAPRHLPRCGRWSLTSRRSQDAARVRRDIADFSCISGVSPPDPRDLHVADVVHRATIEGDESGTTARAATAVALAAASPKERPRLAVFRADHPFLFAIHHRQARDPVLRPRRHPAGLRFRPRAAMPCRPREVPRCA